MIFTPGNNPWNEVFGPPQPQRSASAQEITDEMMAEYGKIKQILEAANRATVGEDLYNKLALVHPDDFQALKTSLERRGVLVYRVAAALWHGVSGGALVVAIGINDTATPGQALTIPLPVDSEPMPPADEEAASE